MGRYTVLAKRLKRKPQEKEERNSTVILNTIKHTIDMERDSNGHSPPVVDTPTAKEGANLRSENFANLIGGKRVSVKRKYGETWDIYIGHKFKRAGYDFDESIWANPYNRAFRDGLITRQEAVELCLIHVLRSPELVRKLPEIRDKILGCWCEPGELCHGDILIMLANAAPIPEVIRSQAEVFELARERFDTTVVDQDSLPRPLARRGRDALVHRDTDKARFFRRDDNLRICWPQDFKPYRDGRA